jgi:hypothetical protein
MPYFVQERNVEMMTGRYLLVLGGCDEGGIGPLLRDGADWGPKPKGGVTDGELGFFSGLFTFIHDLNIDRRSNLEVVWILRVHLFCYQGYCTRKGR